MYDHLPYNKKLLKILEENNTLESVDLKKLRSGRCRMKEDYLEGKWLVAYNQKVKKWYVKQRVFRGGELDAPPKGSKK